MLRMPPRDFLGGFDIAAVQCQVASQVVVLQPRRHLLPIDLRKRRQRLFDPVLQQQVIDQREFLRAIGVWLVSDDAHQATIVREEGGIEDLVLFAQ